MAPLWRKLTSWLNSLNLLGYEYLEKSGVPRSDYIIPLVRAKKFKTMEELFDLNLYPTDPNPSVSLATEPAVLLRACCSNQIPRAANKAKINLGSDLMPMKDQWVMTRHRHQTRASVLGSRGQVSSSIAMSDFAVVKKDYDRKVNIAPHTGDLLLSSFNCSRCDMNMTM